jgi:hypothetical protein
MRRKYISDQQPTREKLHASNKEQKVDASPLLCRRDDRSIPNLWQNNIL